MIKTIKLVNFRSWKKVEIDLSPGVNAFIGPSDGGKTNIIRAIDWAANNRPLGDALIKRGQKNVLVQLQFGDSGKGIIRRKAPSENMYQICKGEKTLEEFKAFGKGVPEEIQELLNFSDLNIQGQFNAPFLLAEGPSKAARYLNRVINLEVIDGSISKIGSIKREAKSQISLHEKQVEDYEEQLKRYDFVEEAKNRLSKLEMVAREIKRIDDDVAALSEMMENIRAYEKDLEEFKDLGTRAIKLRKLQGLERELEPIRVSLIHLAELMEGIEGTNNVIFTTKRSIPIKEKELDEYFHKLGRCPLCLKPIGNGKEHPCDTGPT